MLTLKSRSDFSLVVHNWIYTRVNYITGQGGCSLGSWHRNNCPFEGTNSTWGGGSRGQCQLASRSRGPETLEVALGFPLGFQVSTASILLRAIIDGASRASWILRFSSQSWLWEIEQQLRLLLLLLLLRFFRQFSDPC